MSGPLLQPEHHTSRPRAQLCTNVVHDAAVLQLVCPFGLSNFEQAVAYLPASLRENTAKCLLKLLRAKSEVQVQDPADPDPAAVVLVPVNLWEQEDSVAERCCDSLPGLLRT